MTQHANRDDDPRGDDPYEMWDASYVLGSLSGTERRDYEAHLATCARCSAAVAELSGMPAILAQLTADEVQALDEPAAGDPPLRPEVLDELLHKVQWRRRRTRRFSVITLAAAAAVLVVAVVIAILPGIRGNGGDETPMASAVTMSKVAQTPINATVTLTGFGWGTRIDMVCTYGDYASRGEATTANLGMVLVGHNGTQSEVATWIGVNGATAMPSGNTTMQKDQIKSVQLVDTDTRAVLLQTDL
ncbi:anti-sigma factor [Mycobacterium sp. 1274761.0]|uniref:anti-sigma factor family protein n=1 Tax=Mycobacterium sp. 1274761.0 TaxID=1834077 RepID=UPI0007FEB3F7|nr:zf-HC2 domain-containing protein [Mycobacterium sp. 1274761.0]OBK70503.1 anti-sigma factor [Mycobacterium sp. 1274761.0]